MWVNECVYSSVYSRCKIMKKSGLLKFEIMFRCDWVSDCCIMPRKRISVISWLEQVTF